MMDPDAVDWHPFGGYRDSSETAGNESEEVCTECGSVGCYGCDGDYSLKKEEVKDNSDDVEAVPF